MQNTMRFSELHCREVINLCDGARMGEVERSAVRSGLRTDYRTCRARAKRHCRAVLQNDCVIPWGCIYGNPWGRLYSGPVQTEIGGGRVGDDKAFSVRAG